MRIRTLNADGTRNDDTVTVPIKDAEGALYDDPPVTISVRTVPRSRIKDFERQCVRFETNPRTRGTQRVVDWTEVAERTLIEAVQSWDGVLSTDGEPVPVCEVAVRELPPHVKEQLGEVIGTSEAFAASESSFRQP